MGYSYCILITGTRYNILKNLYYTNNGGSYGFYENHYFVNHRNTSYTYTGKQDMCSDQYLFTLDELKAEYIKLKSEIKSELIRVQQKINKEGITWCKLLELKDTYEFQSGRGHRALKYEFKSMIDEALIDEMISLCENEISAFVSPFGELERYYKECKKYEQEGYSDIKLIYGFSS